MYSGKGKKGAWKLGNALFFFFVTWIADASGGSCLHSFFLLSFQKKTKEKRHIRSLFRHVAPLPDFCFSGLAIPDPMLFLRGEISRRVENAASDGGGRHHSQERRSLAALLPRSPGEARLPERSHLGVVGESVLSV